MILHRYFARRFLWSFLLVSGVFFLVLAFLDLVEQAGRYGDEGASLGDIVGLTLLDMPQALYEILPLLVILATIALFMGLARSSEMVVTRAAGRSALRALVAPVIVTLLVGAVALALWNPIVAATSRAAEARGDAIEGDQSSIASMGDSGIWMRQSGAEGQSVIRAESANLDGTELSGVTFVTFDEGMPVRRIEAASASLGTGSWQLTGAKVWPLSGVANAEASAQSYERLSVSSSLTADQIRDSFGTPSSIAIWELPRFIDRLQAAGFSARRHQVWFQSELAQPLFLVVMVLIGASLTMRHQRGSRTGLMVLTAILLSFGLYFLRNFAMILGENGQVPVALSAWAPPVAGLLLSLGLLLHLEDG